MAAYPSSLTAPHWRYAGALTGLAFAFSQPFALLCFVVVGGVRPGVDTDWGFLLMFEICALLATAFAGLGAALLAWRGTIFGPGLAIFLAVGAVVLARIVTASLYFAALTLPYAVVTSFALSWLIPEIVAGVTALMLHRKVFGIAHAAKAGALA